MIRINVYFSLYLRYIRLGVKKNNVNKELGRKVRNVKRKVDNEKDV